MDAQTTSEYRRKWRLAHKERVKAQEALLRAKNPQRYRDNCNRYKRTIHGKFENNKREAIKRRKLPWILDFAEYYILVTDACYYCEREIPHNTGSNLDRIDNTKGYEWGNVLPCCGFCNTVRMNNLTVEETKIAITAVMQHRQKIQNTGGR